MVSSVVCSSASVWPLPTPVLPFRQTEVSVFQQHLTERAAGLLPDQRHGADLVGAVLVRFPKLHVDYADGFAAGHVAES